MNKETLIKYEPRLATLFVNSRKKNRLANAYLLYGDRSAPLKDIAVYLAMSLNCEKDYLACHECPSCKRFDEGIHPDFNLIDGQYQTIKKDDIKTLENKFAFSALEKDHRLTYVINCIDNITEEGANAILKFLEEPKEGQVAFLTSYNITKVLPTILSRSIQIRIDPLDTSAFYQQLMNEEFIVKKKKTHLSSPEAYILSRFTSEISQARFMIEEETGFDDGYQAGEAFLNDLAVSSEKAGYTLLLKTAQIKELKCYNWLYLTLNEIYKDVLLQENDPDNPFNDIIRSLENKKPQIQNAKKILDEALALKQINLNPTAILSKMILALEDED
ncbi:MAG: hypothetical protein WCR67_00045 [Bacilli bacterium]